MGSASYIELVMALKLESALQLVFPNVSRPTLTALLPSRGAS